MLFGAIRKGPRNHLCDVGGLLVGNAEDEDARTGVTVVLPETRAVAGVDMRGGGPGTRETDALDPACLVDQVDAVVLSGGSSYGLDAASGVAGWLGARGRGFRVGSSPLVSPIVPAAILFDLANGGNKKWGEEPPYRALGRDACEKATEDLKLGNAGAGLGATAGQYKGGLGSSSALTESGLAVAALMAANPFGAAVMPGSGCFWAAPFEMDGEFGGLGWPSPMPNFAAQDPMTGSKADVAPGSNTSIGVVATNADLTPAEARRVAIMAQDGLARAVRPIHTPVDGDTIFVLATGAYPLGPELRHRAVIGIGALAADCVARAMARGVYEAECLGAAVSWRARHGRS
ncbi:peptidase S58 DmpA [Parvibaculum lavamentivorans DS-1]|uniref:Peptidase S58 DmpA n=1 Tax=Parvibaculum lavamentivorans (strain DS-1 / DSM 13023 / NCIMB 13966) TaxID=402881 RepID=A7HPV1_PARL1|nr:P1 family peptidase [Parvibaculum lavamentivorans]ABS61934.1 peptidase S58 DmpA [Parvibaculum lavamentivorans DS-1]